MRSAILWIASLSFAVLAATGRSQDKNDPNIASTPHLKPAEEKKHFHLPPGFEIQLVAAEPDIHKPLNLAFDDRGRLWLTDTVEYPYPTPFGKKARDTVKILEDFAPDGRARKITTFAEGLTIPMGLLPLSGVKPQEALVFSMPSIYLVREGQAGREVLYTRYGSRDTHGLTGSFTRGFDGWVYACHGFSNDSKVKAKDGSSITMNSGNTYRIKDDGSHIEQFTHGQVNPFGIAFDPLGNLYSADCHTEPIYQLLRGAWYPSFGKPHDGLGFGPAMFSNYTESTAVAGLAYYAADNYPPAWRDSAYIGDVMSHRVNQFAIQWHGSSPKAILKRFLESDDPWFRPVHVQLGPDGALYIADFYNRIIGHYEVPLNHPGRDRTSGRVWRIVYRGDDNKGTPAPRSDWTTVAVSDLIKDLSHPNLTVRFRAMNQFAVRGGPDGRRELHDLLTSEKANAWQWMHGLWLLERGGDLDAALLERGAKHTDRGVRVHAQRILSERTKLTPAQHALAVAGLKDADANVQRAAADALGRHPAAENIRPLLDLRHRVPGEDTHLLHVVRMALRDQLRPAENWPHLASILRDERDARAIADVSLGVPSAEAAAHMMKYLRRTAEHGEMLANAVHHIARYGAEPVTKELLDFTRGYEPSNLGQQVALFHAIEHGTQERGGKLAEPVRAWAVDLTGRLLASRHDPDVQSGIELAGALRLQAPRKRLAEIARGRRSPEGLRKASLDALANMDARGHANVLGEVLADAGSPFALREQSANLLARANQPETRAELLKVLPTAPARLQTIIAAGLAASPAGCEKLLEAVKAGRASARLLQEPAVEPRLKGSRLPKLKERLAELTAGLPPPEKGMIDRLNRRRAGFLKAKVDAKHGAQVFTKNCGNCHQVGGQGAKVGPQLDGVGVRGLDRLLEDVLDPNRNVDQAFRLTTLNLKKGQVVSGLLLREEGEVLVLADNQGKEVRVAKNAVDERNTSQMSPMPSNFTEQVTEADFYDLLAYLLTLQSDKKDATGKTPKEDKEKNSKKDRARIDCFGDPLPEGALARLGTTRLRHGNEIVTLAISPDGKILATAHLGDNDSGIRLWDLATGALVRQLDEQESVRQVVFSPDGKILASGNIGGGNRGGTIYLWRPSTGEVIHRIQCERMRAIVSLAISPDGKTLAAGDEDIALWDVASGKLQRRIFRSGNMVTSLAFSPNGKLLAAEDDYSLYLWDPETGKKVRRLEGKMTVPHLAFTPDGKYLAAGGWQPDAVLWEVATGKRARVYKGQREDMTALAISPNGKLLATCGGLRSAEFSPRSHQEIRLWELATGRMLHELTGGTQRSSTLAFTPASKMLIHGADLPRLYDVATGKRRLEFASHEHRVLGVSFLAGGTMRTASPDGTARTWKMATGREIQRRPLPAQNLDRIAFAADGNHVACAELDGTIHVIAADTGGRTVRRWKGNYSWNGVHDLTLSPDGGLLAVSNFSELHLYCVATGELLRKWREFGPFKEKQGRGISANPWMGPDRTVQDLLFSPDGRTIAWTVGNHETAFLGDVTDGAMFRRIELGGPAVALAFSTDGRTLAIGEVWTRRIRGWEVASGRMRWTIEPPEKFVQHNLEDGPMHLQFSPDGRLLARGGGTTIQLWDVARQERVRLLPGHGDHIASLAFSPDSSFLASGSWDTTALIWDLRSAKVEKKPAEKPIAEQLLSLWDDLKSKDAEKAYRAILALAASPRQAMPFLRQHMKAVPPADARKIDRLIADLESDRFEVRELAVAELRRLGPLAGPALRRTMANHPPLETRRRVEPLLAELAKRQFSDEELRDLRAVELLESIRSPETPRLLEELAKGTEAAWLTREAKASLRRLAKEQAIKR